MIERFWPSPWGYNKEEPIPEKEYFFPDGELEHSAFEDFLQHNAVFYNLLQNRVCHMDSYMTGVDFENLDFCFKLLTETYNLSNEDWAGILDEWESQLNMQIPAKICLMRLRGKLK